MARYDHYSTDDFDGRQALQQAMIISSSFNIHNICSTAGTFAMKVFTALSNDSHLVHVLQAFYFFERDTLFVLGN